MKDLRKKSGNNKKFKKIPAPGWGGRGGGQSSYYCLTVSSLFLFFPSKGHNFRVFYF